MSAERLPELDDPSRQEERPEGEPETPFEPAPIEEIVTGPEPEFDAEALEATAATSVNGAASSAGFPAVDREKVKGLDGRSYRAIAGALDVDPKTVRKDAKASGDPAGSPEQTTTGFDGRSYPATARLSWQRLSDVPMRSIVFVDKPLLQADAFHLVAGRKGQGKGTLLSAWAAAVTRGELGPKRNVVWIGSEDSAAIDIHPRIVAAGGDPARILVVKQGWIQFPRDIDEIRRAMGELGDVGMLVIDPVGNHITGKSSNSDTDIRDAIAPLNAIADEHECMVFGVRHLSEKECTRGVLAAILGASAWVHVPRAVLAVAKDNEDASLSHIQCVAGNRLPPETPGRIFRIEGVLLPGLETEVTRASWLGDSSKSVETLLGNRTDAARIPAASVQDLILAELATGEKPRSELDRAALEQLGAKPDTVYKSGLEPLKNDGQIKARKDGTTGPWLWRLSGAEQGTDEVEW